MSYPSIQYHSKVWCKKVIFFNVLERSLIAHQFLFVQTYSKKQ